MEKIDLKVIGLSCGHCKSVIEGSVGTLSGVEKINVNLHCGIVTVEYDSDVVSLDKIRETFDEQGYNIA